MKVTDKRVRYQVFEKDGPIHNFSSKKAAQKKWNQLKKEGKADGEIWDTKNNSLSRFFNF